MEVVKLDLNKGSQAPAISTSQELKYVTLSNKVYVSGFFFFYIISVYYIPLGDDGWIVGQVVFQEVEF